MSGSYRVPSMREIEQTPWNGYNVVSTFSGAGGSCLGYRMAGYRVIWSNEFIPAAQDTYRANHPNAHLNTSDIRNVTPEQVLEESGMDIGEIDIFDGSPPCAAFSTAGAREKHWGKAKKYSDTVTRVDDLFFEYTRLLKGLQPKTFVAENVSGLIKGVAKGYFKNIIGEMKSCGYEVNARLLNAKYLGVPQARERIIFVGVRKDLCDAFDVHPTHPKPSLPIYTVGDALENIEQDEEQRVWLLREWANTTTGRDAQKMPKDPDKVIYWASFSGTNSKFNLIRASLKQPSNTILQTCSIGAAMPMHPLEDRTYTISELKRITSIPDDFILTGTYEQQWERLGRMVPPVMMSKIAKTIQTEVLDKIGEE